MLRSIHTQVYIPSVEIDHEVVSNCFKEFVGIAYVFTAAGREAQRTRI